MKTGIATTVSVVGVLAAGVAAFAVNSSVLGSSSPTQSAIVSTTIAAMPNGATAVADTSKVGALDALATPINDTTTTYKVGAAGTVVIDISTGSIVVTAIAPNAGFTSEPARTDAGGVVKVHFVSATQRIEFTAQLVNGEVKVNVTNEGNRPNSSVAPRPHDDDDHGSGSPEGHDGEDD